MRSTCSLVFSIGLWLALPNCLAAQIPVADIRPMLKSLTKSQKLNVLEYLRHLGADTDLEIQKSYEQVARKDQLKTIQYIETLKKEPLEMPQTTVQWSRDTLFFGTITEGSPLIDSFLITNTGEAPYLITSTKTTCDCTVLRWPTHPVMPGESAVLRVEFDSRGKMGLAIPAIVVYDNSSPNKRSILYLKGQVTPRKRPRKNPWED